MVDVIENVKKIVDLGLAIKEAVDTAKHNERDCRLVVSTVGQVCGLMQMLRPTWRYCSTRASPVPSTMSSTPSRTH